MRLAALKPGDVVEAKVNGVPFTARYVRQLADGYVEVEPIPDWATWHRVKASQIKRRVEV